MKVKICGNSHVAALQKGLETLSDDTRSLQIFPLGSGSFETQPFSVAEDSRVRLTCPQYAENTIKHTGQDSLDASHLWGLCMGTHNARVYRDGFWAGAEPTAIVRPGFRPVSDGLLDGMILSDQHHIRTFMRQLMSAQVPFFVLSCSPPRLDHHCLSEGVRRETVAYVEARSRALFKRWLHTHGVPFIDPPLGSVTEEGFLRPEYNAPDLPDGRRDPHHANQAYGALMMRQVLNFLEKPGAVRPPPLRIERYGEMA